MLGRKIAGVDMLRSSRGPLLLEVNPSPGLEGIEHTTGIDVAGRIIDFVSKKAEKNRFGRHQYQR
jgi:ribosomal protein S6--L-glutamate ligase